MQSFRTSFGLNLLEDLACSSSPLTVRNLMDLVASSDFSSGHAIEFLQWYVICCLAWSLNNWRNSSWLGSDTYSSFERKDKLNLVFLERQSGRAVRALETQYGGPEFKSNRPDRYQDLFTVVPSSSPRPCLWITNWFASGQLGFFTQLILIWIKVKAAYQNLDFSNLN